MATKLGNSAEKEQKEIQQEVIQKETWIIDGNYGGTLNIRIKAADTVIFLDYSRYICVYRALKRMFQYRNKTRPDMVEGNDERLDLGFLKWIWNYPRDKRSEILKKLDSISDSKKVIILKSPKEAEHFLERVNT